MDLRDFIKMKGLRMYQFAEAIGIPSPHLSEILHGRRGIPLKLAIRILEVCEGDVTLQDLADIPSNRIKRKRLHKLQEQAKESERESSSKLQSALEWCRKYLQ